MLVIQYTAQSTNYRKLASDWENQAREEIALRETSDNQQKLIVSHLNKVVNAQQEELAKLQSEMGKIASRLSTLNNELLAERQKTASLTGQVTQLTNMVNTGDTERKQLQGQLETTRKDNSGLRTDNFKLAEGNNRLELQRQLYEQQIRLLKEQNYSLGERLDKLRVGAASETPAAAPGQKAQASAEPEGSPIIGEITKVHDSLASISIGSAHGVKEGMDFIIYRNGQFLGKLRINKVLPDQSAGELMQTQGNIRSGDKVTDKFQS